MKTQEEVTEAINGVIEQADEAYAMGCLISSEFCSPAEYREPILEVLKDAGWTLEQYQATLSGKDEYEFNLLIKD
jgi:hypothetical protein